MIKRNQATAYQQLADLPRPDIAFPHARLALRVHRRRTQTARRQSRETIYAVTSLDAHLTTPAELPAAVRGRRTVEALHHVRDVTYTEDASTIHTGTAPRAMATFRNLATGPLKTRAAANIATTTRAIRDQPERALPTPGHHQQARLSRNFIKPWPGAMGVRAGHYRRRRERPFLPLRQ